MSEQVTPEISKYFAALGRKNKGCKKVISEADRQRRRDWARGLAAIRKNKAMAGSVVAKSE